MCIVQDCINVRVVLALASLLIVGVSGSNATERDPLQPRVPLKLLEDVRTLENPIAPTPQNIRVGKELYDGFALCSQCHGFGGKGDGAVAINRGLDPSPRDFTNPEFHAARTDGELFWVVNNGSPGTAMPKMTGPGMINEEQAWYVINYIRTFSQQAVEEVSGKSPDESP